MIISVGEILADMIGSGTRENPAFMFKAGGAPFNVACAAKKFGAKVAFYGSVGNDVIGDRLCEFARSRAFDRLNIERRADANTTLAFVSVDECGEREFGFYRKHTADALLPKIPDDVIESANIVHIGSLMLSEESGAEYATELMSRAHALGKKVSFDTNFRTDIFSDTEAAVHTYKRIFAAADIIKFSQDELDIFGKQYVDEELKDKYVFISMSARGSMWQANGECGHVSSTPVKAVDTTGAGDAFFAGVLTVLDEAHSYEYSADTLNFALSFGNACGALNTLGYGAIDCLPDRAAVEKFMSLKA